MGNAVYRARLKGKNLFSKGVYSSAYALFFLVFNKECEAQYEFRTWNVTDAREIFGFWHQLDDPDLRDLYQMV